MLLKTKVGLSTGRASELMQLADGRKDLQELRDATAQRVKTLRAAQGSSLQSKCNEEASEPEQPTVSLEKAYPLPKYETTEQAQAHISELRRVTAKLQHQCKPGITHLLEDESGTLRRVSREAFKKSGAERLRLEALEVIDSLLDPEVFDRVVKLVIEGERHHRFDEFCSAVSALYQKLAAVGK